MKPEQEKHAELNLSKFPEQSIELNTGMELIDEDIASLVSLKDLPRETLKWKYKTGFPTYYLNPKTRLLIVYFESGPKAFRLKEESTLLKKYVEKYGL